MGDTASQPPSSQLTILASLFLIFGGCCSNIVVMEALTNRDPDCGDLMTLAQFLFVTFCSALDIYTPGEGFAARRAPLFDYVRITVIFFVVSILNNRVFGYGISVPVHTVFRSSSLVVSMIIGMAFFRKKYSIYQMIACVVVFIGTCITSLADSGSPSPDCCDHTVSGDAPVPSTSPTGRGLQFTKDDDLLSGDLSFFPAVFSDYTLGILLLIFCLFGSGLLGHLQNKVYTTYGRIWRETLFWTHLLSLVGFVSLLPDLIAKLIAWSQQDSLDIAVAGISVNIPTPMLVLLALNMMFQYICIRGVFVLTSSAGTLACVLALTCRKMVSLLFSVWYFEHAFTRQHWLGAAAVFAGIGLYNIPKLSQDQGTEQQVDQQNVQQTQSQSGRTSDCTKPKRD